MKKQLFLLSSIGIFLVSAYMILNSGVMAVTPHNHISYTKDIRPILESRCSACHIGNMVSAGLNMNTYQSLMTGSQDGPVIIAGDAHGSLLIKKVTSGQMPKRGPKLTPSQIQLITDWINAGALDN